jgi:2-desacetyl-2-hydroxyethyl bacteriochlorophyllide A dehydrogenase
MLLKQVVVTGPNAVELQRLDLDDGELGPAELLVETESTFISAGTEISNYLAKDPDVFRPGTWCAYPWRSGYANVGVVRAKGRGAWMAGVGERVFTYGPHASVHRYDTARLAIRVPEAIEPDIAAASRMASVALCALYACRPEGSPWVVVFGLGMVGNIAAQSFAIRGYRVIGVDPLASRREIAATCGILHAVGGAPDEVQQAIVELTDGKLAGIAIDAVGHASVIAQALEATAACGELVLLGTPRVPVQGNITTLWDQVHRKMVTVRGALEWFLPMYPDVGRRDSQYSKQEEIFDWIARGLLKLDPMISHRLRPEQVKQAYEGLLREPDTYTGVVLDWRSS